MNMLRRLDLHTTGCGEAELILKFGADKFVATRFKICATPKEVSSVLHQLAERVKHEAAES